MNLHRTASRPALAAALLALAAPGAVGQLFSSDALGGAVLGAVAGGVIGNNSRHSNTWEGAAIGAGAGLLLGSLVGEARGHAEWSGTQVPYPTHGYSGRSSWGHHGYSGVPVYSSGLHCPPSYTPVYRHVPVHDHRRDHGRGWRSSGAASGLVLGALAGGVIGNNSRHSNTWEGAAIGAGAGFLLGSIADQARSSRRNDWPGGHTYEAPAPGAVVVTPGTHFGPGGAQPPVQNITIINHYHGDPSRSLAPANSLFGR